MACPEPQIGGHCFKKVGRFRRTAQSDEPITPATVEIPRFAGRTGAVVDDGHDADAIADYYIIYALSHLLHCTTELMANRDGDLFSRYRVWARRVKIWTTEIFVEIFETKNKNQTAKTARKKERKKGKQNEKVEGREGGGKERKRVSERCFLYKG